MHTWRVDCAMVLTHGPPQKKKTIRLESAQIKLLRKLVRDGTKRNADRTVLLHK